ncbi:MAG: helix-turn-helix domain-containing protein [Actinobacteria bacterium]|nr:helix-turn-helix domain-containing protein [Actinomycetota bacterium]
MARPSPQTDRVIALVEVLAARPDDGFTLAELTRRLRVNKSTCHSMLTALAGAGWLLRDPYRKTYRLGPALAAVGRAAASGFPALDIAHAAMVEVGLEAAAHCAALGIGGDHLTVLDEVRDLHATGAGFRVGTALPVRPPFGTALVAWSDDATVEAWLAHVPGDRRARYRAALDATRARGFAVELSTTPEARLREAVAKLRDGDPAAAVSIPSLLDDLARDLVARDDVLPVELDASRDYTVSAINAPVLERDGRVALVLSLTGFARTMTGGRVAAIGRRLTEATDALSGALAGAAERAGSLAERAAAP